MDRSLFTAKFKRDYVAASAVVIFFFIVLSEITLAIGIPGYLLKSDIWALQIQRQNLIEKFDLLRHSVGKAKIKDTAADEENKLVIWTLNMMANYLRTSRDRLKAEQINALNADLTSLQLIAGKLAHDQPYSREIKLDTTGFMQDQCRKLTATPEKR